MCFVFSYNEVISIKEIIETKQNKNILKLKFG